MWTLDNPGLVATVEPLSGGVLTLIDTGAPLPEPIAILDPQTRSLDVVQDFAPTSISATIPANAGAIVTLNLDLHTVTVVQTNGQLFTPAIDPDAPQSGEFVWNPIEKTLTLHLDDPEALAGQAVLVLGGTQTIPTDWLPGDLLAPLAGLPVVGKITFSESLEQQPTGAITLACRQADLATVRSRLKNGTELTLFRRGWSVSNLSVKLDSSGVHLVSASLTGKWARPHYQAPSRLRSGVSVGSSVSETEPDPDCSVNGTATSGAASGRRSVTVAQLADRVGVPFFQYGSEWSIPIPDDTPFNATATWTSEAQSRVRQNGAYLDFARPSGVYARSIESGRQWAYEVKSLDISYQGDCRNVDDHQGYAVEYPNTQLTGDFRRGGLYSGTLPNSDRPSSDKPNWVPRKPVLLTLSSGDADLQQPPDHTTTLKTLSLNWDVSGPTKTQVVNTTEDGQPVASEEFIYGFMYTAKQIADPVTGELKGVPEGFWKCVSYKKTTYLYDPVWGYALGYDVNGWRMSRFKQEGDEEQETIVYSPAAGDETTTPEDAAQLALYQFKPLPLLTRSRVVLLSYSGVYTDIDSGDRFVGYKACNPDGTSRMVYVPDPTYAPPLFVVEELTYTNSFASTPNPDNPPVEGGDFEEPSGNIQLPPLITGEESYTHLTRTILPSKNTVQKSSPYGFFRLSDQNAIDLYTEWRVEDAAQNSGYQDKAVRETFEGFEGRPSIAPRKPPLQELEEPEPDSADDVADTDDGKSTIEYYLTTPGYSLADPPNGSISFDARSLSGALLGAKTDLKVRDVQESIQYSFEVLPNARIRPFDRIRASCQGEVHQVCVVGVEHEYNFEGRVDGVPLLTSTPTRIQAGIDRTIPVTLHTRRIPKLNTGGEGDGGFDPGGVVIVNRKITLGELIVPDLKTRRNF